jgi:hypothetical protein
MPTTKVPQLSGCLTLEWGVGFWGWVILGVVALIILFLLLIWFFGVRHRTAQNDSIAVSHEPSGIEAKAYGGATNVILACLLVALLIGGTLYGILISDEFRTEHSVAVNAPSRGVTLEEVREKYKGYTRVAIDIKEAAKKFSFMGNACTASFVQAAIFRACCRGSGRYLLSRLNPSTTVAFLLLSARAERPPGELYARVTMQ